MIDPRFYRLTDPLSASDIAARLGTSVVRGETDRLIGSVAAVSEAGPGDLCFLEDKPAGVPDRLQAGLVLADIGSAAWVPDGPAIIEVKQPRAAFAAIAKALITPIGFDADQPAIHPSARLHPSVRLGPGVVIGPHAALGERVEVGPNAVIGAGVQVGAGTKIGANASLSCALIGDQVTLYPGVVIGEVGFGLAAGEGGADLTPHFGRVIIQNRVSIGANSCIDRGLLTDTVIGEGTHIDNLCQIGHNCRIGAHVVMAAFAGVSGSTIIGDGAQLGGRVGLKDHLNIGAGARLAAGAASIHDVPAGETWSGYPAKPIRSWMRELAWLARSAQKRPTRND